jgi:hypothetical protein
VQVVAARFSVPLSILERRELLEDPTTTLV